MTERNISAFGKRIERLRKKYKARIGNRTDAQIVREAVALYEKIMDPKSVVIVKRRRKK